MLYTSFRPDPVAAHGVRGGLDIHSERGGKTHRLAPSGELDIASAAALERELLRVEQTDACNVTLDLSGLTFMDGAGVHVLLRADARSRQNGARLHLIPAPPHVQRVLAIVGVEQDLPFTPGPSPPSPAA